MYVISIFQEGPNFRLKLKRETNFVIKVFDANIDHVKLAIDKIKNKTLKVIFFLIFLSFVYCSNSVVQQIDSFISSLPECKLSILQNHTERNKRFEPL